MKSCLNCKYAEWAKTSSGRLHPSGEGYCKYVVLIQRLPESMYWAGSEPKVYGGFINRKKLLDSHCATFNRKREE